MDSPSTLQKLIGRREFGPLVLLIVEIVAFSLLSTTFLSTGNLSNLLAFTPEMGMMALGMTMLITAGEFDLSVGSVFGLAPIIMWTLFNQEVMSLEAAFFVALGMSVLIGFFNGWFVTKLKIPSFLVTLGMMMVARGTALYITDGFPQRTWRADSALTEIIVGDFYIGEFRVYASLLWFILFAVV
ncbi:MAG: ABC transporter permease, partial [Anaerolineae bacterium]|nr:ABC transporter permease [Anaerolineae bacterium]